MIWPYEYDEQANRDVEGIFDYYEVQRAGLGEEFLGELGEILSRVRRLPLSNRTIWRDVRRARFYRFPHYGMFHRIEGSLIAIVAVYHASRDPAGWQQRV